MTLKLWTDSQKKKLMNCPVDELSPGGKKLFTGKLANYGKMPNS
jgi:hypothetical protein